MARTRRPRRQLTDEEIAALLELLHGRRPSIGAWAALIAAVATLLSAITASVLAILDRIVSHP